MPTTDLDALGVSWKTVDNAVRRAVGKAAALGLREYLTGGDQCLMDSTRWRCDYTNGTRR